MVQLYNERQNGKLVDLKLPFPAKLHVLLERSEVCGTRDIVAWLPDGKSFKVHDTITFTDKIMCSYFSQTKYNSFRRQCYIYGFRLRRDGAFVHRLFRRDDWKACLSMKRNQEGDGRKKTSTKVPHSVVSPHKRENRIAYVQDSLSKNVFPVMSLLDQSSSHPCPNEANLNMNFFEQSLIEGDWSRSPQVSDEIEVLADNIFGNIQYLNPSVAGPINFDFAFKDDDLQAIDEDVFRLDD